MSVIDKIKSCKTMRELDELRIEVIVAAQNGEDFEAMQKAFIKKQSSLRRNGHSRWTEGYSLNDVLDKQKAEGRL